MFQLIDWFLQKITKTPLNGDINIISPEGLSLKTNEKVPIWKPNGWSNAVSFVRNKAVVCKVLVEILATKKHCVEQVWFGWPGKLKFFFNFFNFMRK